MGESISLTGGYIILAEKQTHFEFDDDHYSPDHEKLHTWGSKAPVQFDTRLVDDQGNTVKKLGATTSSPEATKEKMPKK